MKILTKKSLALTDSFFKVVQCQPWPNHKVKPFGVKGVQIVHNGHTLSGFAFGDLNLAKMATFHLRALLKTNSFSQMAIWVSCQHRLKKNIWYKNLKWRVAIVAKCRKPNAKPTKVWLLGTIWTSLTQSGWVLWFVWGWHCITFKKKWLLSEYLIPAQNSPRLPEIIGPILGEMLDPDSSNI